jgi:hypothetical protein
MLFNDIGNFQGRVVSIDDIFLAVEGPSQDADSPDDITFFTEMFLAASRLTCTQPFQGQIIRNNLD